MLNKRELIDSILNITKNKEFKREKIRSVEIEMERDNEFQFNIGTDFAVFLVGLIFNDDNTITSYGNIKSTAYDEIDDLLYKSYDECVLGDWMCEFEVCQQSADVILEEIFNQIAQDEWKVKFKLLWKAYKVFEKLTDQFEELDSEYLLHEMAMNYFDK